MDPIHDNGIHAFLFNADEPSLGSFYGKPCIIALFNAVIDSIATAPVFTRIYLGDMLIHGLCDKITKVDSNQDKYHSITTTHSIDKDLYISIITDLNNSIMERYNTISVQDLSMFIARHNIYCIVLTNLSYETRNDIDIMMKTLNGYIGVFEIDPGNPLHIRIIIESLIYSFYLHNNILSFQKDIGNDDVYIPSWLEEIPHLKTRILDFEEFIADEPKIDIPQELSERGKISADIIYKKGKRDHFQQLALELSMSKPNNNFQFVVSDKFSFRNIVIPPPKLTEYVLNIDHEDGKHKAMLFRDLLSIRKNDWRYLAAQISNGLTDGVLCNVRTTDYGIQYHIDIPVKGLNGESKTVRTGWITKNNNNISLTTAYIVDKSSQKDIEGIEPLVVKESDKELYWETLYNFAHSEAVRASQNVIPTPMHIVGYSEPIMEGEYGYASVIIKDARKSFPRWLKRKNIGSLYYKGGWNILAKTNSHSVERAKAYAEAFEKILFQNGIECSTMYYLD